MLEILYQHEQQSYEGVEVDPVQYCNPEFQQINQSDIHNNIIIMLVSRLIVKSVTSVTVTVIHCEYRL